MTTITTMPTGLVIDSRWTAGCREQTFSVENPSTQQVLADVAGGDESDAERALRAAGAAQRSRAATSRRHRSELLYRAYAVVLERSEQLAALITSEMGKPLAEAQGEV
ncbi:MAG: aldehyde dehydrogenase family protein, partial [Mycobacterium sp.]